MTVRIGVPGGVDDVREPWRRGLCPNTREREKCEAVGAPLAHVPISTEAGGLGFSCPNAPVCLSDPVCVAAYRRIESARQVESPSEGARVMGIYRRANGQLLEVLLYGDDALGVKRA